MTETLAIDLSNESANSGEAISTILAFTLSTHQGWFSFMFTIQKYKKGDLTKRFLMQLSSALYSAFSNTSSFATLDYQSFQGLRILDNLVTDRQKDDIHYMLLYNLGYRYTKEKEI